MPLELVERLATLRTQLNAEIPLPGDCLEKNEACEIISNKVFKDGKPDWEGLCYRYRLRNERWQSPSCRMFSENRLKDLSEELEKLRSDNTATTHWKIAIGDKEKTTPSLLRVTKDLRKQNGVQVQQLTNWISGEWSPVGEELKDALDKLHVKVLWEKFFGRQFHTEKSAISLVYFFKVGGNILGIWVLHGYGDEVVSRLEGLSNKWDSIAKLIEPSILCLSESVKKRLDDLSVIRWDLALLLQNSLRVETAMTLEGFKHDVEAAGSTSIVSAAQQLLEASPCDDHKGLESYYETVFDHVMDSPLPKDGGRFLPKFSSVLKGEECFALGRLYVGWNLMTRDCGIPRRKNDHWHKKGKAILAGYFQKIDLSGLHTKISNLWDLRSKKDLVALNDQEKIELHRLMSTLPDDFWQIVCRRVFQDHAATWEEFVNGRLQDEEKKSVLLRLPRIFFLEQE